MEKVVYLLGAGFSAPLDLPVMRDFLIRSKDLYFGDPVKFKHFERTLGTIAGMHRAKSYYEVDLFNIEEILSILEMVDTVKGGKSRAKRFSRYISDVIQAYTPDMPEPSVGKHLNRGFGHHLFPDHPTAGYALFTANLAGLQFEIVEDAGQPNPKTRVLYSAAKNRKTEYGVVTLNYDRVLENCRDFVETHYRTEDSQTPEEVFAGLRIAKLHGSVDGPIVPPTWKKLAVGEVKEAWRLAYELLTGANHLRILGYSLPVADTYVRYLLEAAVIHSAHLKTIDVICQNDEQGNPEKRYREFIKFKYLDFKNCDIAAYINPGSGNNRVDRFCTYGSEGRLHRTQCTRLEEHHRTFMTTDEGRG